MDNSYENIQQQAKRMAKHGHRRVTGGGWESMGQLQLETLKAHGLAPQHRLIDVGCGSLRGGVLFVPYLDPGHYYGLDANQTFTEAGLEQEFDAETRARIPAENFRFNIDFTFDFADVAFDYACAFSLFTHLSVNKISLCLDNLRPLMAPGGQFLATFFTAEDLRLAEPVKRTAKVTTWSWKDPYHYSLGQIEAMAAATGWGFDWVGDFGHPRGQLLARFIAP